MTLIRIELPTHLQTLANLRGELRLEVPDPPTLSATLDAIERAYPQLRGTIRDQATLQRRPFLRFFACAEDITHDSPGAPLPAPVASGHEPLLIIGAIAGG